MKQLSIFILILSSVSLFADAACTGCGGSCGSLGYSYTAPGGVKTCVPCAGGYYQNLANHWSKCNQCAAACSVGRTEITACTATTNRVCSRPQNTCSCSNGAAATGAACTSNGANMCTSCSSGYYKNGNTCTGCRSACGAGTRETTACSSSANRVCIVAKIEIKRELITEWTTSDGKGSWETKQNFCTAQGKQLCTYVQLCPNGIGPSPTGSQNIIGDQWVPIQSQTNGNKWIQAGTRDGGKCNPLSTYHGSTGAWMESTTFTTYKIWNICCDVTNENRFGLHIGLLKHRLENDGMGTGNLRSSENSCKNDVVSVQICGGPTAASSPRVKKLEHRIHVQLRIVKNQDVILRNSHNILFNANTVESILLCCAIVILLSGVTFDSDFVLRNNAMRLTLTYAVITIILVSISYFVFVFIHEFRMTTKKHRAVKSLRWKNMASKARSMSNGYHGEDKDGDGKDDRMQSSNPFSINRKSKGGGLLAALKAKNTSDAKEGREHRARGGKGGVGGSTDTVIAIYKEEEDNIFDLGSSDEEGDTKEKAMEKAMEKVEEIANVARTNGASKQDIAKQGAEALHALDISMHMKMSEIELFNGSSDDEEDDAAFNKIFPDKNIKKDTVKQDSLTQDSNLLYGVSKSKADQDVNKSAHLKAMHEAELHQIESDAHKQAAEIMQFSSKAILAHRFKAKAAQLRSEKRLQARIAAQQKARALEEIQRKQKEERQRKIIADEAKQAKHDAEIKSIRSILLSLVPSVSRLKVIFERLDTEGTKSLNMQQFHTLVVTACRKTGIKLEKHIFSMLWESTNHVKIGDHSELTEIALANWLYQSSPALEMVTSSDEDEEVPAVALSVHVPASQSNPMAEMDDTSSEDEDDDFFSGL